MSRTAQRAPHAGATISSALGLMDRHCGATEEGSDVCRAQSSRENCRRPSAQSSGTMIVTLRRPRLDRERLACISALLSKGSRTRCGVIAAGLILPYHINLLSAEGRPVDDPRPHANGSMSRSWRMIFLKLHRGRGFTPIVPVNGGMLIHSKFITGMAPAPFGEASEQFVLAQV